MDRNPRRGWWLAGILAVAASIAGAIYSKGPDGAVAAPTTPAPGTPPAIGCLGRVEPEDGVVRLAARSLSGQPSIVGRLFVREGEMVRRDQELGELDSRAALDAARRAAEARVEVARKRLAQVRAGAKPTEIAAQRAEVDRLQAEVDNAEREYKRRQALDTVVSATDLDTARLRADTSLQSLRRAKEILTSLTEIRPVDVELAEAELRAAIDDATRARVEYEASLMRSPLDGRVIKIFSWPGEEVRAEGVMELARVDPMYVVAEVAESDLSRLRVGQRARISAAGLPAAVSGTVERIGSKVLQNEVMPVDPARFTDGRVVETWIKVDDSRSVAHLIHLRVEVVIQP